MYNSQLDYVARQVDAGDTFVIAPSEPLPIGRVEMDPRKMQLVYSIGRRTCLSLLPDLREFLHSGKHAVIEDASAEGGEVTHGVL